MISPDLHLPWSALFRDFHISRGVLYFYLYISFPDRDFSLFGLPPFGGLAVVFFFSLPRHQLCPGISIYPLSGGVQINGVGEDRTWKEIRLFCFFFSHADDAAFLGRAINTSETPTGWLLPVRKSTDRIERHTQGLGLLARARQGKRNTLQIFFPLASAGVYTIKAPNNWIARQNILLHGHGHGHGHTLL
jgi:hypothetical protein